MAAPADQVLPDRHRSRSATACSTPTSARCRPTRARSNTLTSGHRACQGCGEALGARYVLDAAMRATERQTDRRQRDRLPRGVLDARTRRRSWQLPWIHSLFGNAPAVATGVAAALKAKGRDDVRVIGQGGDGGTVDIGFGCLSGMFERNDDVLFVCYDNEGYMNTGVQRSGATPPAARTATTQAVGPEPGNVFGQGKSAPLIAMAHEIPYVATATVADLRDLEAKVERAMELRGAALPPRARALPARLGLRRRATRSGSRGSPRRRGLFPVFEAEHGEVVDVSKIRRQVPVEEYLQPQTRYAHLFEPERRDRRDRARSRRAPTATSARFGLLPWRRTDGQALRHHAGRRLEPGQQDRLLAHRACPSTSHRLPPCNNACPAGENMPGVALPRRGAATTSPPGGRSWRTTRSRPSWAGSATTRARPPATAAQLDEAVGINSVERFLGDEAIRQGWTVEVDGAADRQARARRRRRARPACRPPTTSRRRATRSRSATPGRGPAA